MLSEDANIRFYTNPKMIQLPIGIQSEVMSIFEDVLNDVKEENSNATVSELLSTAVPDTISTEFAESNSEFTESASSISGYASTTGYTTK